MNIQFKYITAEFIDISTHDDPTERSLIRWKIQYYLHLSRNHYWEGTMYWDRQIFDEVQVRKEIEKQIKDVFKTT